MFRRRGRGLASTSLDQLIEKSRSPAAWPGGVVPKTGRELLAALERQRFDMVDRRVLRQMRDEVDDQWGWDKGVSDKQATLTRLLDRLVPEPDEGVLIQADLDKAREVLVFHIRSNLAAVDVPATPSHHVRGLRLLNSLFDSAAARALADEEWVAPSIAAQLTILARGAGDRG